jgi:hypothetical protein
MRRASVPALGLPAQARGSGPLVAPCARSCGCSRWVRLAHTRNLALLLTWDSVRCTPSESPRVGSDPPPHPSARSEPPWRAASSPEPRPVPHRRANHHVSFPPDLARPAAHENSATLVLVSSLPGAWGTVLLFILVPHRAWPDLQRMKVCSTFMSRAGFFYSLSS